MSIETIKVNIDNDTFYIQQFIWEECVELETITISILSPALDMLEGLKNITNENGETDFDLKNLGMVLQKILFSLRKENPFAYIKRMVNNTFFEGEKGSKEQLNNDKTINRVFHGKTITCMKLLIEIMKANKFAFIGGLVGSGLNIIGIFKNISSTEQTLKKELEK